MLDFSAAVKDKLRKKGLSSKWLAEKMGYTPQYLSDLFLGERRWNVDTMSKACEALGLELIVAERKAAKSRKGA